MKVISPQNIIDNPADLLRIGPILYEIRSLWLKTPNLTFGELLLQIIENEYDKNLIYSLSDDEFLSSLQNL